MKRRSGITPLWSDKEVEKWFDYHIDKAEERIYKLLQRAGEEFVKIARNSGKYIDHTGNLRSSIGYVIAINGKIVAENFAKSAKSGTDKTTGVNYAARLSADLAKIYNKGYVLIGVAGMKYAVIVEAMDNKDVISSAGIRTEDWIRKQSKKLFDKISNG